jgi:hypothetical protein
MRRAIGIAAGFLTAILSQACPAQSLPGSAPGLRPPDVLSPMQVRTGTILTVDPVSMNFVCAERDGAGRYWMTLATRFRAGARRATFFDLRTGEPVQVMFHRSGRQNVADLVVF